MNATFPTALLLILVLLVQSAAAVAAILPCAQEGMVAPAGAPPPHKMSHEMSHEMSHGVSHSTHSMDHHPDALPAQMDKPAIEDDRPDCCEQMNAGPCASGGCAAGTGSAMTVPLLAPSLSTDLSDRLRPVADTSHYLSPSSTIFRPPIS